LFKSFAAIGTAYEMYSPIVATEVIAEKAVAFPSDGNPKIAAMNTDSQTALTGVCRHRNKVLAPLSHSNI
jgi:hypothetical protein